MFVKQSIIKAAVRSSSSYFSQNFQQLSCRAFSTNVARNKVTPVAVPKFTPSFAVSKRISFQNTPYRVNWASQSKQFSTATAAATDVAKDQPKAVVENLIAEQKGFVSRALRDEAKAKYENLPISPRKLEYLCRLVRGMSVREALVQLRLCNKRKAYYLRKGIRTTANGAVNTFNMMKDRLVVDEIYATKGLYYKRLHVRARGRANVRIRRKSHLVIKLREQPYHKGEFRIGRYGRTIEHWKRVDRLSDAWKLKRAEEAA